MNRTLWVLFFLVNSALLFSQDISFHNAYGSGDHDFGIDAIQLVDSSYVILGNTSSFGNGNSDVLLVKIDSTGSVIWSKTFGTALLDHGSDIELTTNGEIIVVGYRLTASSDYQNMVLKLNSDGDLIWEKIFGSDSWDFGERCLITSDNRIIISGNSNENFNSDVYVVELDQEGEIIQSTTLVTETDDFLTGITEDSNSQIIISANQISDSSKVLLTWLNDNLDSLSSQIYALDYNTYSTNIINTTDQHLIVTGYYNDEDVSLNAGYGMALNYDGEIDWIYEASVIDETIKFNDISELDNGSYVIVGEILIGNWDGFWHAISDNGAFISTGGFTVLGNETGEDRFLGSIPTNDKGVLMMGTTETFSNSYVDIWAVKLNENYETPFNASPQIISSLNEHEILEDLLVYPNPASSYITIDSKKLDNFEIYDQWGRKIIDMGSFPGGEIDIQKLTPGRYFLILYDENKLMYSGRFTKSH